MENQNKILSEEEIALLLESGDDIDTVPGALSVCEMDDLLSDISQDSKICGESAFFEQKWKKEIENLLNWNVSAKKAESALSESNLMEEKSHFSFCAKMIFSEFLGEETQSESDSSTDSFETESAESKEFEDSKKILENAKIEAETQIKEIKQNLFAISPNIRAESIDSISIFGKRILAQLQAESGGFKITVKIKRPKSEKAKSKIVLSKIDDYNFGDISVFVPSEKTAQEIARAVSLIFENARKIEAKIKNETENAKKIAESQYSMLFSVLKSNFGENFVLRTNLFGFSEIKIQTPIVQGKAIKIDFCESKNIPLILQKCENAKAAQEKAAQNCTTLEKSIQKCAEKIGGKWNLEKCDLQNAFFGISFEKAEAQIAVDFCELQNERKIQDKIENSFEMLKKINAIFEIVEQILQSEKEKTRWLWSFGADEKICEGNLFLRDFSKQAHFQISCESDECEEDLRKRLLSVWKKIQK